MHTVHCYQQILVGRLLFHLGGKRSNKGIFDWTGLNWTELYLKWKNMHLAIRFSSKTTPASLQAYVNK